MTNKIDRAFENERRSSQELMAHSRDTRKCAYEFMASSVKHRYCYNFDWLGLPIIQYPTDIVSLQELVWKVKPTKIIETGVARGGSLSLSASLLALLDATQSSNENTKRLAVGVDIDIREHNRQNIESHPLSRYIRLIEGSSIDAKVSEEVGSLVDDDDVVMVLLDSNHTHEHVLRELEIYSTLVSPGSYLIVYDTVIADLPDYLHADKPWCSKFNPKSAVKEFLKSNNNFVIDSSIEEKSLLTVCPSGFLKRV